MKYSIVTAIEVLLLMYIDLTKRSRNLSWCWFIVLFVIVKHHYDKHDKKWQLLSYNWRKYILHPYQII